jgi:hypothetical protein
VHASTKTMAYHCVVTGVSVSSVQREFYRSSAGGAARRPRTGNLSVGGVNVSAPRCANLRQCDATIADLAIGRACVVTSPKFALFDFFGDRIDESMDETKATRPARKGTRRRGSATGTGYRGPATARAPRWARAPTKPHSPLRGRAPPDRRRAQRRVRTRPINKAPHRAPSTPTRVTRPAERERPTTRVAVRTGVICRSSCGGRDRCYNSIHCPRALTAAAGTVPAK